MTTLQKIAVTAAITVTIGAGLFEAHQAATSRAAARQTQMAQSSLNEQVRQLQARLGSATNQLAATLAENARFQSNSTPAELLKLRGDMAVLSRQKDGLQQMIASLQNSAATNQRTYQTNPIPRETWGFAGFGTPEAAIQSTLWAKSSGNESLWLSGLATNMVSWLTNGYVQGNSDEERQQFLVNQTKNWTSLRVLREIPIDDDTVLLQIEVGVATGTHVSVEEMKNIDGKWITINEFN